VLVRSPGLTGGEKAEVFTVVEKAAPSEEATTNTMPVHIMYTLQ
jgi:hypothetical protein